MGQQHHKRPDVDYCDCYKYKVIRVLIVRNGSCCLQIMSDLRTGDVHRQKYIHFEIGGQDQEAVA